MCLLTHFNVTQLTALYSIERVIQNVILSDTIEIKTGFKLTNPILQICEQILSLLLFKLEKQKKYSCCK